jgi:hypothetical protein
MTDDRSFERAARSWLETGPTEAPDRAVDAALLRIQTTRQERDLPIPWRARTMTMGMRLATAAAAVVVVAVVGILAFRPGANGVGSVPTTPSSAAGSSTVLSPLPPSAVPSPSTTPSDIPIPAFSATFTSPRHGYEIRYPLGWTVTPATKSWSGNDGPDFTSGNMDILQGGHVRLVVESAPLGSKTPDQWRTDYANRNGLDGVGVCDVLPPDQPRIAVGPVNGYLDGNDCPGDGTVVPGDRFDEALVFTGGRVYLFWIQGEVDRPWFEAILATVTLDPSRAVDRP